MGVLRADPAFAEAFIGAACPPATRTPDKDGIAEYPFGARSCPAISAAAVWYRRWHVAIEGRLQDIAAEIGMTREALYRAFAALEVEGHLTHTETAILLKKSDAV